eukprot:7387778-Prymnesium_polylepis.1
MRDPYASGPQPSGNQPGAHLSPSATFVHNVRNRRAFVKCAIALRQAAGARRADVLDANERFECVRCALWGSHDAPPGSPFAPAAEMLSSAGGEGERGGEREQEPPRGVGGGAGGEGARVRCCQKPQGERSTFDMRGPEG